MKRVVSGAALAALTAGGVHAGGLDRSGQGIGPLFETGRYVELSFGRISPSVSGTDLALPPPPATPLNPGGQPSGDVGNDYSQISLAWKNDISDQLSYAVILDQPFGASVTYAPTSVNLGNTSAAAESTALTFLLRYKLSDRLSVHGGPRLQRSEGDITLRGAAYGPVNGYNVNLASDTAWGYSVGAAYEIPDIALRVALTYNSEVTHDFATTESGPLVDPDGDGPTPALPLLNGTSTTETKTPQSINLDFQTGIAEGTLLFGGIRWAEWSAFRVDPVQFGVVTGGGLVDLEDTVTYTLGIGRRFNETWSGSAFVVYEKAGDPLVSPLAPSTGQLALGLAAVYTQDNMKITTGIRYVDIGEAQPETGTPDVARASFTGNSALSVGVRVGFNF